MLRSMRSTIISLLVIVAILTVATWTTVSQDKARLRVEETFAELLIGQSAQLVDIEVSRQIGYYQIIATVLTYSEADLSSADLATLEKDLEEAVRGPVEIDVTVLSAWRDDLTNVEQRATLIEIFNAAIRDRGAAVQATVATYTAGRYVITAEVYVFDDHSLTEAFLDDLRVEMTEEVGAPVTIDATFIQAANIASPEPTVTPVPTPAPTAISDVTSSE